MRESKTIRRRKDASKPKEALPTPLPSVDQPLAAAADASSSKDASSDVEATRSPSLDADALMAEVNELTSDQFAALMSAGAPRRYRPGDEASGRVVRIEGETIFVDVGSKSEALLSLSELEEPPEIGAELKAYVLRMDGSGMRLTRKIGGLDADIETLEQAREAGVPVEGRVKSSNSGGFTVMVGGMTAFCPHSQIDRIPSEDKSIYIDQSYPFRIIDIDGRKVVLSRRAILDEEAAEKAEELWEKTAPGDLVEGVVTGVRDFGVFVDIGGIQGLVHISELSWDTEVTPPSRGDRLSVRVLEVDRGANRISLSMKDPALSPWNKVGTDFVIGELYTGTVVRLTDFGAFIKLAPGLEGLVHISNISKDRIEHPSDVLKTEQRIEVRLLNIDDDRQRLGLGIKQVSQPDTEAPQRSPAPRRHTAGSLGTMADLFGGLKLK